MSEFDLTTPVLFLVFNRPDTTIQVFEAIRQAKPKQLFVAADGPRADRPGEEEKCEEVRQIATNVDWDCVVKTLFRDTNLGCKVGVSRAIDWFFQHVEEGIILEDDCLPTQSFFWFCQELLKKYRDDERVMHISGDNFQNGIKRGDGTYYFSRYGHIWGWATWRRAWKYYEINMKSFPQFKKEDLVKNIFKNKRAQKYWMKIFQAVYICKIDTWDYQWNYAIWTQNGLCILPNLNLVSNIGFGNDSTHTMNATNKFADMPVFEIHKIIDPSFILQDREADRFTFNSIFKSGLMNRIFRKLKALKNEL